MNTNFDEKTIVVTFDYYGNKDYGKRVFWVDGTNDYIWVNDFVEWRKEKQEEGFTIVITNEYELADFLLSQTNNNA
jgi:hypothetical protein